MAEAVDRRSALAAVYAPGTFGAERTEGPGVSLKERRPLSIVHVAGDGDHAGFRAGVKQATGTEPPTVPNTSAAGDGCTLLWLARDRWLALSDHHSPADLEGVLRAALDEDSAVTDVSHGRTVVRIGGPAARTLLAKGCPLDLHPARFECGHAAHSHIGPTAVLLHAVDEAHIDLYVARGFGLHMWEWLTDAAGEFGYRVEPAGP